MQLDEKEWDSLTAAVKKLLDDQVISDPAWLDKVNQKKITLSELTWMNTIALSRK